MKTVDSFNIQIWIGLREQYSDRRHTINEVYDVYYTYCQYPGHCVTITPTRFVYKDGWEDGAVVGFINYARFPKDKQRLIYDAWKLADRLMIKFNQIRASITTPEKTYLLGED